jgi:5-methylcytosine-specific restriction endonuclease McrA
MYKTIIELRKQGKGVRAIAKEIGVSKTTVQNYCNKCGLGGFISDDARNPEKAFSCFVNSFNKNYGDKYIYIGGYTNGDGDVRIECKKCHMEMQISVQSIRKHRTLRCLNCIKIKNESKVEQKRIKEENKRKEKEEKRIKELTSICSECGKVFIGTSRGMKYCSKECIKKHNRRVGKIKRRTKVKENGDINWNITLDKLINRDKNVCHICGGKCDKKDYEIINGNFIAGNSYPSIDHVVPVSKGGTHTWDNIRLAHHYCNAIKNNNMIYENSNGQLTLAI